MSIRKAWAAAAACVLALLLAGCATGRRRLPPVEPLALLGDDAGLYVAMPVSRHRDLAVSILCGRVENLSPKDAGMLADHVAMLYAAVGSERDPGRVELVAQGDFPSVGIKAAFSKKNGWARRSYEAQSSEEARAARYPASFQYYLRPDTELAFSFPEPDTVCAARDIRPLLERYALRPSAGDGERNEWLASGGGDIMFYVTRPGDYMRVFLGQKVSFGCEAVFGALSAVPPEDGEDEGMYELTVRLRLANKLAKPVVRTVLAFSFELFGGGQIRDVDALTLELSGTRVSAGQIEMLLASPADK